MTTEFDATLQTLQSLGTDENRFKAEIPQGSGVYREGYRVAGYSYLISYHDRPPVAKINIVLRAGPTTKYLLMKMLDTATMEGSYYLGVLEESAGREASKEDMRVMESEDLENMRGILKEMEGAQ